MDLKTLVDPWDDEFKQNTDMKFTVQGKDFLNQINASAKVLNAKNTIGILDNFLIELLGNQLKITASDTENVMTSVVEAFDTEGEGRFCVPAKRLLEMMKEISNQPIKFNVGPNYLVDVEYLNGKFNFMGVDPAPYPMPAPLAADAVQIEIPGNVIAAGLGKTMFAVSSESVRPVMTGILWDFFEDKMIFVSSDTHKLVRYENTTFAPGREFQFVLHSKTAGVVSSLLGAEPGLVELSLDANSAIFKFDRYQLNCRFLKGKYPQYDRVIPKDNPYEIVVDRASLSAAVRRVGIFASKASMLVRFGVDDAGIKLSTQDLDYSLQADESVACDYNGSPMSIGFRTDYTLEVLNNLSDDTVVMKVSDSARPALFVPQKDLEGESVVMLQMPVQVID